MLKTCFTRVLHEKFLLLQLTVIFMAQKAMLIVRVTFTGILSDSVRAKFTEIFVVVSKK